jgi:S-adenosylmethionine synthetase
MKNNYFFTSESVTEGHPDKIADLISDQVACYLINGDEKNRAAIETMVTSNKVIIAGEAKSSLIENINHIEELTRQTIKKIGYEQEKFHWNTLSVNNLIHGQSKDIAKGTDNFGAGDQGMMFGYACSENESLMPSAIYFSHKITKALSQARHGGENWLGPDGKAQVTVEYSDINKPLRISDVVCSTQHSKDLRNNPKEVEERVKKIIAPQIHNMIDKNTDFKINPTGSFVIGGPDGDVGLTGRKIIVDTYGGYAPHGGGAFSGKDCTKVDRSGAYMARYIAKNIVASGISLNATVQLSYAIGIKTPVSLYVYCDGKVRNDIADWISKNIDLTPLGIIRKFDLFNLNLSDTTNYGHFGKAKLPWEKIDIAKELKF